MEKRSSGMGISEKPLPPDGAQELAMDKPIPPGVDQDAILNAVTDEITNRGFCLLYTSPSPRDRTRSRMPSSA